MMTLADLPGFAVGRILSVQVDCDDLSRLQAMGICQGRTIQLVQAGDPLIVRVLGTRVGLSQRLAAMVSVELLTADCGSVANGES